MSGERLKVGLGTYAGYVAAGPGGRMDWLADARRTRESPFSPGGSYYEDWERAARHGRFNGDDADRLAKAAEDARQDHRRAAYEELTGGWLRWLGPEPRAAVKVGAALWSAGPLDVSVRPRFGLRRVDGGVDVLWMYVKGPPLAKEAGLAALRLLELSMDGVCRGGTPVVLDVRRGTQVRRPARWRNGFDAWLASEAAGLAALWAWDQAS
ncbi:MAG: hypothetical protein QOE05_3456 [Actinomycetota bacterium]|jgi:hypothetical protein|nr:hypothetical protein [Actinomycetota bacterium]